MFYYEFHDKPAGCISQKGMRCGERERERERERLRNKVQIQEIFNERQKARPINFSRKDAEMILSISQRAEKCYKHISKRKVR
jgi:hypothetical protein